MTVARINVLCGFATDNQINCQNCQMMSATRARFDAGSRQRALEARCAPGDAACRAEAAASAEALPVVPPPPLPPLVSY